MKAVKRFDPERGVRLASFAIHWIKAEIHEYILRNWRMVKVATTKAQRKLFFNLRSMKKSTATLTPDRGRADREDAQREGKRRGRDGAAPAGPATSPSTRRPTTARSASRPIAFLADAAEGPAESRRAPPGRGAREPRASPRALAGLDERSRRIIQARWLRRGGAEDAARARRRVRRVRRAHPPDRGEGDAEDEGQRSPRCAEAARKSGRSPVKTPASAALSLRPALARQELSRTFRSDGDLVARRRRTASSSRSRPCGSKTSVCAEWSTV